MNLRTIFNEFKSQAAFVLFLIWLLAIWHSQSFNSILYPLVAVFLMTALDLGITWVRSKKLYWPSASFVTGALIGLILPVNGSLIPILIAVILAWVSKQFINTGIRQHIFNPAAFGIMIVSLAFGVPVAWWTVSWGSLPLIILVPAMIRILWKMKRIWIPVTFLLTYLVFRLTTFDPKTAALSLIDGSLLLFALVMLTEPITSPVAGKLKYIFGISVALISIGLSKVSLTSEVFLPALLICDLGAFLIRKAFFKAPKAKGS